MPEKQTAKAAGKPAPKAPEKAAPTQATAQQAAPKKAAPKKPALAATTTPIILDNAQLAAANAAWVDAVTAGNLYDLFEHGTRLTYVTLSAPVAAQLLVQAAVYLKARFVVYAMPAGQSQFTVALAPADAEYNPLTGWYLCDSTWTMPPTDNAQVPYAQAKVWMNAWQNAPEVMPSMFEVPDGTLQGYNFSISDLSSALNQAQPLSDKQLRMNFGLNNEGQTFGLVLRVQAAGGTAGPEVPCYDMAAPVPPHH